MYARILIAIAVFGVALAPAHAQAPSAKTGSGTVGPGTPGVTGPTGYGPSVMSPGTAGSNQAQTPGLGGSSTTDCANAAQAGGAGKPCRR